MSEPKVVRHGSAGLGCTLIPDKDGAWVRYSDYEALAAKVEELEREIKVMQRHELNEIERLREALERQERIAFEAGYRYGRIQKDEGYATFYEGWQSSRFKEE